ncbi:MAG: twin-arginine translocase subunit TatA, partial [Gammaproteobacteria bacterium]|nr:twin-arginine translocase subunit TatA [Gammaproteobacteria bacterium]
LRNAGSDLGSAIRSFRKGLQEDETADKKLDDASGQGAEQPAHKAPTETKGD